MNFVMVGWIITKLLLLLGLLVFLDKLQELHPQNKKIQVEDAVHHEICDFECWTGSSIVVTSDKIFNKYCRQEFYIICKDSLSIKVSYE